MQEQEVPPSVFLIDKPVGLSSFRIVQLVRRALRIKKVGHAGTLDPFASGLLVVCAGRAATKHISSFMEGEKEYLATLQLGVETDSQDLTGEVLARHPLGELSRVRIDDCVRSFQGERLQRPPSYSALKYKGKPLYYYARKGIEVKKEPRPVFIREIETVSWQEDRLEIRVVCSKGTYIRTLAADIGSTLGCGAHLIRLRRIRSGRFSVRDALSGSDLQQDRETARRILLDNMLPVTEVVAG